MNQLVEGLNEMIINSLQYVDTVTQMTAEAGKHGGRTCKNFDLLNVTEAFPKPPSEAIQVVSAVESLIHVIEALSTSKKKKLWRSLSKDSLGSGAGTSGPATPVNELSESDIREA